MKKLIFVLAGAVLLVPAVSFAAYLNGGQTVLVNPSQTINDNAYVAGGTVAVSGTINGDLFAAGGTVSVSGKVAKDIMVGGGTVVLTNVSSEDVRVGGGNVTIGGTFTGEMMVGGGQVVILPGTQVAKDSYLGGGTLTWNGVEAGNLTLGGGNVYVNGTVSKNLVVKSSKEVTIGSGAVIKGDFEYSAPVPATIESGAQIAGTTTFHKVEASTASRTQWAGSLAALFTFWWLIKLGAILTAAYLLWYIWRRDMVAAMDMAVGSGKNFGSALLRGFAVLILLPIAAVLCMITVIGFIPGFIALLGYVAMLFISESVAVLAIAFLLNKRKDDLRWFHILFGAMVFGVVALIPFIGWIAVALVCLASLGVVASLMGSKFHR